MYVCVCVCVCAIGQNNSRGFLFLADGCGGTGLSVARSVRPWERLREKTKVCNRKVGEREGIEGRIWGVGVGGQGEILYSAEKMSDTTNPNRSSVNADKPPAEI